MNVAPGRPARGRRVLIVNLTRLGDLLQTSPTIASLRAQEPGVHISVLADKNFAEVCRGIPGIDETLEVDLDRLGASVLAGRKDLVDAFEKVRGLVENLRARQFDLALNFSSSRMSAIFMSLLSIPDVRGWSATPDGHRVISHPWSRLFATMCLNREMSDFNLVDHYRNIAGGAPGPRRLLFEPSPEGRARASSLLAGMKQEGRLVALQLGASRENRVWPTESFVALGRKLRAAGCELLLLGGKKERALAEPVAAGIGEGVTDLCGRTDIAGLAAVLERVDLLVTGDTGPMHLAAAVDTPIVGLFFGPALPFDTGPYGADHVVLHAAVACAPCSHSVDCLDAFCRIEITPDRVAAATMARLSEDWAELDRLASQPGPVRSFRTGFDEHGFHVCHRLGGGPPSKSELLRRAYRAVWLAALSRRPLPTTSGAGEIDVGPFGAVAAMARRGLQVAGRLEEASAAGREIAGIAKLGDELSEVESSLDRLAAVEPVVRPLTQMFKFEQESLEPGGVTALARAHRGIYAQLEFEAAAMTSLLSVTSAKEGSYAGPSQ